MPYVNVYLVDRRYGGPEEGGWWYDIGDPVESILCGTDEVDEVKQSREVRWSNEGRPDISSVLSKGQYRVVVEDYFAQEWPEVTPHYE